LADIETIETELVMADLEAAEVGWRSRQTSARGRSRGDRGGGVAARGDRGAAGGASGAHGIVPQTGAERGHATGLADEQAVLFVANVDEGSEEVPVAVAEHAAAQGARAVGRSSRIESELAELDERRRGGDERGLGVSESSLQRVVREAFGVWSLIGVLSLPARPRSRSLAPAQRPHRPGTQRARSTRHPEGLVRAEVDRLREPRRRRRYAGAPRTRHAAPGGPRLRDGRWRRDHRQVQSLSSLVYITGGGREGTCPPSR